MAIEHEPVLFWDWTGSQDYPISDTDTTPRYQVLLAGVKMFVTKLAESDDAAADNAAAGAAEEEGGGVLTYTFAGHTAHSLGDLNPGNFATKTRSLSPGGRTFIMPAIAMWQADRDEEFSADEQRDINREFDLLVATDGALEDEQQFLTWVASSDPNIKVFFLLCGQGDDNREAVNDYQRVARASSGKVTLMSLQGNSDPSALASSMLAALQ